MRILLLLILVLGVGALIALSPDLAIPVALLLLPGLVTLLLDRSPGLTLARAMLVFQAVASIGPVHRAFYACTGLHECLARIDRPRSVLIAWLAAAVAWALCELAPIGLRLLDDARLRIRRAELQKQRAELMAEWGLNDPGGGPGARRR
ncbi:MAG TPA: hypothetical protein VHB27_08345 [Rhodopila sp.]|uniref:hypothetical protein n=1 Tax=Rhodopila sp. TaxID=2480087 RepID=UPI002B68C956|nr:hypothetical protein [Rhodopila sp.]HVY15222.1 hypothetical protein [Rhodopila sp.]